MSRIDTLIAELCPDGVEYRKLGEIEDNGYLKLGRGKVISKKDIAANLGNYPIYSASAANDGKMGEYGSYMFDDVRLTWSVDGGGKFFYRDAPKYSVTNVCGWLKVLDEQSFSTRFLYYVLSSQWSTMTFDYVTKAHPSVIRELYRIPIVPMSVQREIVRILDSFAELEARKAQYTYYRDCLLSRESLEAMDGKPVEMMRLGDAARIGKGTYITQKQVVPGKIPVILGGTTPAYWHNKANHEGKAIVISRSGANAGFVSYWDEPIFVSDGFIVETDNSLMSRFLYHALKSVQNSIDALRRGSGVPHVNGKMLAAIEIPIPSLATQQKVVDILDRFDALTTSLTDGLPAEIEARRQQYEYYRNRLLDFPRKEVAAS